MVFLDPVDKPRDDIEAPS
ncbi:MAG TPA: hypothetical protein LFW14_06645 [Rickettsia endosymbiont of Degeeriella rufa]|nr:hypothetical protein [Rickettsia endosymbiont of Columbicola hoogstraali]HJD63206.1 hypothetical protein [Rickettsia endosymbiont of Degeeriella rufa]